MGNLNTVGIVNAYKENSYLARNTILLLSGHCPRASFYFLLHTKLHTSWHKRNVPVFHCVSLHKSMLKGNIGNGIMLSGGCINWWCIRADKLWNIIACQVKSNSIFSSVINNYSSSTIVINCQMFFMYSFSIKKCLYQIAFF